MGDAEVADLIRTYLRLVEARDLVTASALLHPDAEITFPGGRVFGSLDEQIASSAGRFRGVRKSFDRVDVAQAADRSVVYVSGHLEGEDLDGQRFTGVRYIDRFTVEGGLIVEQMVWNDLAELGIVRRPGDS